MKELSRYFNEYLAFTNGYLFLRVIYIPEINTFDFVWWEQDGYRHKGTIGQWRVKQ